MTSRQILHTTVLTLLSLIAFGANAVICRWALDHKLIDPVSFTSLRLASAAISLWGIMGLISLIQTSRQTASHLAPDKRHHGSWTAAIILFIYAISFSYGYVTIRTGTGALVLAAVVQFTMMAYAFGQGDRFHLSEWLGAFTALIGLIYLVYPNLTTPSWWGLIMVTISAIAWALYSLNGQSSSKPLADTAYNFYRTLPMIALASLVSWALMSEQVWITPSGIGLALISGGLTTGLGYILWYMALPKLSTSLASAIQLLVPLIAAFGASWLIEEPITLRFVIAAILMLGGLSLVLHGRNQHRKQALADQTP